MSCLQPVNPEAVTGQSTELLDSVNRKRERIAIAMAPANRCNYHLSATAITLFALVGLGTLERKYSREPRASSQAKGSRPAADY